MERRIFERVSLPVKFSYEIKTRPQIKRETNSKNISGNGICISLNERLLPKTELFIEIDTGDSRNTVKLNGKVIWSRRVEIVGDNSPLVYYDTGVELINADPININRIITCFYGKSF